MPYEQFRLPARSADRTATAEIGDDEYLSQYGSRQGGKPLFWSRPRPADTDGLSATIGRLTPAEARRPVRMVGAATSDDGVRFNECWSDPLWHEESGGVGHE